ncbi:NACHT, LRR and PYD domains-containing protein 12-like [Triplophysa rosa]|uniref:NACHT, LRR and PYD domains-containing protein 12-like n=1 Tax=Triplophysa rosa TaxID=992332 RepID=UPI002545DA0D|nr:NACHT, LRR and PYD domains-containing protein 12-like [Triplophysa rosa]XP_057182730.1 NACHT, LRR and PYD domains-containing protein 12-like [Triplophysa rosa]
MDRSESPEHSCVSMKSDWSMEHPPLLKEHTDHGFRNATDKQLKMDRSKSADASCVSMKSDWSMEHPPQLKEPTDLGFSPKQLERSDPPEPNCVFIMSDQSMDSSPTKKMSPDLRYYCQFAGVLNIFRSNLQRKFECLCEGTSQQRNPTLLNKIYTELYITESESGEISNEHEMRQIETQSRRTETEDTPIKCKDIFKPLPAQDKPIRRVLTKGVAGIGKTVSVQKFILDWAEGKENQDVHLIFPLPFRELNLMKDQKLSLLELLRVFFPETKEMEISSGDYKVLFIFDGLDECRVSLDFRSRVRLCDVSESVSVDVMLTNLMAGHLLPSALIWITSRPAAADLIPSECVDRVTEVRGFTDKQKEKYFRKRISDESLNNRIISHLKSSRSLYNMCHIPVFCWISATVLERMLSKTKRKAKSEGEIPKTLTEMYTHFLIIQTNIKHQKDYEKNDEDMMLKLGKLAFEQLVKGNLIFYDEDLRECGIDVAEASVYSGLCTQIFREEFGLYQGKVYCFLHLTVQEHLAALHVLFSFLLYNEDVLIQSLPSKHSDEFSCDTISDVHQRAVDKALQSKNGHLDLFLRFLLGLSLESNQKLLQDLLTRTVNDSWSNEKTVEYIKNRIRMNPSPEKSINLFHCLNELGDQSLVNEVQEFVKSGNLSSSRFSSSQWSAVVFVLLTSEQLDVFNLRKYISTDVNRNQMTPDEVLQKLLPVVEASRSAELSECTLSEKCCYGLASVLTSKSSSLRDLNLSGNTFGDSGVKLLSVGLENPNCKLEKLKLSDCGVRDEGCVALASALRSNPSHLRELNLSGSNISGSGVKLLSAGLEDPDCKLEKLVLWDCGVTDEGCAALASALISKSHLRELNLSRNKLGGSGVKLLSAGLKNPNCKLEKLRLTRCGVTEEGCDALASVLTSNSHLRDLNLSENNLGGLGVKLLSARLKNPSCKLEKLTLWDCGVTDEGCDALGLALKSNLYLRDLDLTKNNLGDSGVKLLSAGLENPNCKLETLWLSDCGVRDEGCVALASALRSNPSHLRELNLFKNKLGDSGVKLLSALKEDLHYKLETLSTGWDDDYKDFFMSEW